MKQIQEYFKDRHGIQQIQQIEAVCFVVRSSQARLTEKQQYIFDSILSIFGQDIKENIGLMVPALRSKGRERTKKPTFLRLPGD